MPEGPFAASFKLKVRCFNCKADTVHRLDVPEVDDAPTCIDDLMASQFLAEQRFKCKVCEVPIGMVVAAVDVSEHVHA